jgi:hypothetical protein
LAAPIAAVLLGKTCRSKFRPKFTKISPPARRETWVRGAFRVNKQIYFVRPVTLKCAFPSGGNATVQKFY